MTYYDHGNHSKRFQIAVCSVGNCAVYLYELLKKEYDILYFVDRDRTKQTKLLFGRRIISYDEFFQSKQIPVLISAIQDDDEILDFLNEHGINNVKQITLE